jgi:hypothetical protein
MVDRAGFSAWRVCDAGVAGTALALALALANSVDDGVGSRRTGWTSPA